MTDASDEIFTQMKLDLQMLTAEQLGHIIATATALRHERQEAARVALINETKQRALALGLSITDLFGESKTPGGQNTNRAPVAPKYRSPDGTETWSGRGRMPSWLQALVDQGKSKDDYLIKASVDLGSVAEPVTSKVDLGTIGDPAPKKPEETKPEETKQVSPNFKNQKSNKKDDEQKKLDKDLKDLESGN